MCHFNVTDNESTKKVGKTEKIRAETDAEKQPRVLGL